MRRSMIVVTATGLLAVGLVGPASADVRTFKTSGSFGFFAGNPDAFLGQLSSPRQACRAGRIVKVRRQKPGRDPIVGSARSGPTGQWTVERANVPRAKYYAVAVRKKIGRNKYCGAWRSSTLRFGS